MSAEISQLDGRGMPHDQLHPKVFAAFDALAPGEALALVDDRDLGAILTAFQANRRGQFDWYVLEDQPGNRRVRIDRRSEPGSRAVTEFLQADHRRLDDLLAAVDRLLGVDLASARRSLAEFRCGLNRHMEIEERILFPEIETLTGGSDLGLTEALRQDHDEIRTAMAAAADALEAGQLDWYAGESQTLDLLLGGHNHQEEHSLYPVVDQRLGGSKAREALVEKMQSF